MTQAQIAERAGVSHATISRFESGHWPSGQNVEGIIDAYVTVIGLTRVDELGKVVEKWMRDEYGGV